MPPTLYAQTVLEHGSDRYEPGAVVPPSLPGLEDLVEHGSVGETKPVRTVVIDSDNRVVDAPGPHVARFDGNFTDVDIADPNVETPLLGTHVSASQHREQEPEHYDTGRGAA